jgi:hypothetical protein
LCVRDTHTHTHTHTHAHATGQALPARRRAIGLRATGYMHIWIRYVVRVKGPQFTSSASDQGGISPAACGIQRCPNLPYKARAPNPQNSAPTLTDELPHFSNPLIKRAFRARFICTVAAHTRVDRTVRDLV